MAPAPIYPLYDEAKIAQMIARQRSYAWDLEKSIHWDQPILLHKPLVALDTHAILFPGASTEQRHAISLIMGLIIATSVCEMEESLQRLRKICFENIMARFPTNPEFLELGDLFFEEEKKHSLAFRRYLSKFAETIQIDQDTLLKLLPKVENTKSEFLLQKNLENGGMAFWWVVAIVEEEFLQLYHSLKPHQSSLEPLYFELHEKHFEEEARHSSFPYMMLELMTSRSHGLSAAIHQRFDLAYAQLIQSSWAISSLRKLKLVKKLRKQHPIFEHLASAYPLLEQQPAYKVLWRLFTNAPYVASLLNLSSHHHVTRFASKLDAWRIPNPEHKSKSLCE